MPVTLLQIVDDAKFKEFLKMPGSWRVQKKIKLIFAEILEDITGNKAETSNTSDLHKVVTLFISKSKRNQYKKNGFDKFREGEEEWMRSKIMSTGHERPDELPEEGKNLRF